MWVSTTIICGEFLVMLLVRGIRGATTADNNTRESIVESTVEMLQKMVDINNIPTDDIAAAIFTTTEDLNAEFPATAARELGWEYVALLDSHEMKVPDSQSQCIRVLLLVNTTKSSADIQNVYLKGASNLRSRGIK